MTSKTTYNVTLLNSNIQGNTSSLNQKCSHVTVHQVLLAGCRNLAIIQLGMAFKGHLNRVLGRFYGIGTVTNGNTGTGQKRANFSSKSLQTRVLA